VARPYECAHAVELLALMGEVAREAPMPAPFSCCHIWKEIGAGGLVAFLVPNNLGPQPGYGHPTTTRHGTRASDKTPVGQFAKVPVHGSVASHGSAAGRQIVVPGKNPSGGHPGEVPLQNSATPLGLA